MSFQTPILRTVDDLRDQIAHWRNKGERIALVPTMGALHHGHISLVELAKRHADRVVVSIFVNPKQFGPNEDLAKYPRQEEADLQALSRAQTDLAFCPTVDQMYPEGFCTNISLAGMTDVLCGASRPGHFDGVATVVTKLLLQAVPDVAIFGEKDYQQLQVIRRFVLDLNIPVQIIGAPLIRDADGLATSSRNAYLSAEERVIAKQLPATLIQIAEQARGGKPLQELLETGKKLILEAGFDTIDYLEFREASTLAASQIVGHDTRLFVAARLGKTRLIDNIPV